jgi:hypothetical protein
MGPRALLQHLRARTRAIQADLSATLGIVFGEIGR